MWDLIGHSQAAEMLVSHIRHGEVRHAYLFSGPESVGKRTLAIRFVQALSLCSHRRQASSVVPAGPAARSRRVHSHLSPIQADHEGGELKVDAVRDLQRLLTLSPYEGKYRVVLLLRFHEANENAQNALLKTLEETPERAILLVTADSAESLLPTISSRCEELRLRQQSPQIIAKALREKFGIPEEKALLFSHLSAGRPGLGIRMVESPELFDQRTAWVTDLWTLLGANRRVGFGMVEKWTRTKSGAREDRGAMRGDLRRMLLTWQSIWRDCMLRACGSSDPLMNIDQEERINLMSGQVPLETIQSQLAAIESTIDRLHNANMQLMFEVLVLDLPKIGVL